jgi:hypothetical protein
MGWMSPIRGLLIVGALLVTACGTSAVCRVQPIPDLHPAAGLVGYFPAAILDPRDDALRCTWYSDRLTRLGEPALFPPRGRRTFRFTWLPSFGRPVAVRLDIDGDGGGTLTVKQAEVAKDGAIGSLTVNHTEHVSAAAVAELSQRLTDLGFWALSTRYQPPPYEWEHPESAAARGQLTRRGWIRAGARGMVAPVGSAPIAGAAAGAIEGDAVDLMSRIPLLLATVAAKADTGATASAFTDANGHFQLDVPPGRYALRIVYGEATGETVVDVRAGLTTRVDVTLDTWSGDVFGLDGDEWILEGAESGRYHVVDRWSPQPDNRYRDGNRFRRAGLWFLERARATSALH